MGNVKFSTDERKFYDKLPRNILCDMNWKGDSEGESSPQEFLEEMVKIAYDGELSAKGLGRLILANLDDSLKEIVRV